MQPIFTMQYGEFMVADYLSQKLKRISVFIPASAQEKGIDILLYRFNNERNRNTVCTIQVKMSRIYYSKAKTKIANKFPYYIWFKRFDTQPNADWYILMGIYAKLPMEEPRSKYTDTKWDRIMLAFTNQEMTDFISGLRQKRDPAKQDTMFDFGFNDVKEIYQTRGYPEIRRMDHFLLDNRLEEIAGSFK